jgi:putative nucleotidyltransferase with HDIG domain
VDSLKDGAYDYILKPFSLQEVSVVVARALEKRRLLLENRRYQEILEAQVASRTQQLRDALDLLRETYHSTLLALGTALDSRDADTDGHSLRVTLYTKRLARQIGVSGQELKIIEQAALLHDIGKIGIPDELLSKPGRLTEDEWVLMRKHPEIGFRILSKIGLLKDAAKIVLQHQERYDGTGYPAGLAGDGIVLGARIFAVADTLDCMTTNRPFQKATTFEAARDEIIRVSGTQLDPRIVQKLLEIPLEEWKKVADEARVQKSPKARESHHA